MNDKLFLNGEWDFMPVYGTESNLNLPEKISYDEAKILVPSSWYNEVDEKLDDMYGFKPFCINDYPTKWNDAKTAVLHREFSLPSSQKGKKVFLNIKSVGQMARVFINDKFVCDWDEMFLPLSVDISDFVNFNSKNDIKVVCTNFESTLAPNGQKKSTGLIGSWYGFIARGIWNDIYLEFLPFIRVSDTTVRTSVKNRKLTVISEITNNTKNPINVHIRYTVLNKDGKAVKEFSSEKIEVKSNAPVSEETVIDWDNPHLWDIDDPYLYNLEIKTVCCGVVTDERTVRFGFREITNDGPNFLLNGKRINLRGDSWHFQGLQQMSKEYAKNWYKLCKNNGVNYIRLHAEPHPEYYLDAADEAGMLIVDETAIYGSGKSMYAGNELYSDRCKRHALRLIDRDKNHPSVFFWSLENEMRWVDGRDIFKKHIPEIKSAMKEKDPTRFVSLDGDNRLISYENTDVESLHYNIDGTLAQWRREKPLTIGEHCGLFYMCPQNASAYVGMKAYNNAYDCIIGFGKKERIFIEDARRKEVSGISTFNFAYYFTKSMPDEDVVLPVSSDETEGVKYKYIRKNSLTINNGLLPEKYPTYRENPAMGFMNKAFKPVTILPQEYDRSFYDDKTVERHFDVYNDTRHDSDTTIKYKITADGKTLKSDKICFIQSVGEKFVWNLELPQIRVDKKTELKLTAELYHGEQLMHTLQKEYYIYPSQIKSEKIGNHKKFAYFGSEKGFWVLNNLVNNLTEIKDFGHLGDYDVLIIGPDIDCNSNQHSAYFKEFVKNGGIIIILEQYDYSLGDVLIQKQPFFSAYTSNPHHPILNGLEDDDFIFWLPDVTEERPHDYIMQNFIKPSKGDINFVLESSAGDFCDGGDFWSPLMEYSYENGTVIMNQLGIFENFETVPIACTVLRNIIEYADSLKLKKKAKCGVVLTENNKQFINALSVQYDVCTADEIKNYEIVITDSDSLAGNEQKFNAYADNGGKLLILPFTPDKCNVISTVVGKKVCSENYPQYHLEKTDSAVYCKDISVFDLYHYEKFLYVTKLIENSVVAENTVTVDGSVNEIKSVPNTPWFDYYQNGIMAEFAIIPLISYNKEKNEPERFYFANQKVGKGTVLLSQIVADKENVKNLRIYSSILSNLGADIRGDIFDYKQSNDDYSIDCIMTLPVEPYQDYEECKAYYTDKEYSLNNLGEGLYGWMLKVEKDRKDGFITIPNSKGQTRFITAFVDYRDSDEKRTEIPSAVSFDCNCPHKLWINGEEISDYNSIKLLNGTNRIAMEVNCASDADCKFKFILLDKNGVALKHLLYHLTVNEVDPK